jgi:hypothetical protein
MRGKSARGKTMLKRKVMVEIMLAGGIKRELSRKRWEKLNGYYEDPEDKQNLYLTDRGCYDCRRVFVPTSLDKPRMCGQMLVDGVRNNDVEVYKDSTCKLFTY